MRLFIYFAITILIVICSSLTACPDLLVGSEQATAVVNSGDPSIATSITASEIRLQRDSDGVLVGMTTWSASEDGLKVSGNGQLYRVADFQEKDDRVTITLGLELMGQRNGEVTTYRSANIITASQAEFHTDFGGGEAEMDQTKTKLVWVDKATKQVWIITVLFS